MALAALTHIGGVGPALATDAVKKQALALPSVSVPVPVPQRSHSTRAPAKLIGPKVTAQSAILVDGETGQVIWARNEHVRRPNASTTKIMTVMLALEHGKLDDIVVAPKDVRDFPESSLHLIPGEKLPLSELIYGACIRSANDAAYAIGAYTGGGDISKFVKMMNDRAKDLGMVDTQFKNANGLNAEGHYSSAYDLALLAREAIKNPVYNQFINTREITLDRTASPDRLLRSRSRFLKHYPGADGIKSGYTREAGHCYIGSATRKGWRLITVVLKSNSAGDDTRALMDFGFDYFEKITLAKAGTQFSEIPVPHGRPETLAVTLGGNLSVVVQKGQQPDTPRTDVGHINIPLHKGDTVAHAVITVNNRVLTSVPLLAGEDVNAPPNLALGFLVGAAAFPVGFYGYRRAKSKPFRFSGKTGRSDNFSSIELEMPDPSHFFSIDDDDSHLSNRS